MRLDGKVVLVTGASRGQGAAEAARFVEEGAHVVLTDVLDEAGRGTATALGEHASYVHLDVASEQDWARVVDDTVTRLGGVDVLVNNAAVVRMSPLAQMSLADFRMVTDINQIGVFLGMRAVIPAMVDRGGGSIVNISSVDGLVGSPGLGAYAATKHAVIGLTKTAALELGPLGIRVNAVCPGGVVTPMLDEIVEQAGADVGAALAPKLPLRRLAEPADIADAVLFLASQDSRYCTGSVLLADGGMLAGFSVE
jgi:3alpha(or 20beta)-hydroxysteroid dehydrogenase